MSNPKRTVLITGCSDGGHGAALAIAFHKAGLHVHATVRDPSKMAHISSLGIATLTLYVLSSSSITACVEKVLHLDILVNNAGITYGKTRIRYLNPHSQGSLRRKRLGVYSCHASIPPTAAQVQGDGFEPDVCELSGFSAVQSVYNASKAAMSIFSDTLRIELQPFGVRVVNLRTGYVRSNLNVLMRGLKGCRRDRFMGLRKRRWRGP
jgi:1-acylglycerone phosphate reductase